MISYTHRTRKDALHYEFFYVLSEISALWTICYKYHTKRDIFLYVWVYVFL